MPGKENEGGFRAASNIYFLCRNRGVCACVCACAHVRVCTRARMCVRCSVMSDSLQPHGLYELNLERLTELYTLTIYVLFVLYIIYINKKLYT